VDCTEQDDLKQRFDVHAYPTLKVFADEGSAREYKGARTRDALAAYARRLLAPAVSHAPVATPLAALVASVTAAAGTAGSVAWLHAETPAAPSALRAAFDAVVRAALPTDPAAVAGAFAAAPPGDVEFVARLEAGEAPQFFVLRAADGSDEATRGVTTGAAAALAAWVADGRFSALTALGPTNFYDIAHAGRLLAIGVVDPAAPRTPRYLGALRGLARPLTSTLPPAVRRQFHFGWLDGVAWKDYAARFNISPTQLPRLLVLDAAGGGYFEDASVDEVDEIDTFLRDVAEGRQPKQREGIVGDSKRMLEALLELHPGGAWGLALVVSVATTALVWGLVRRCSAGAPSAKKQTATASSVPPQSTTQSGRGSDGDHDGDGDGAGWGPPPPPAPVPPLPASPSSSSSSHDASASGARSDGHDGPPLRQRRALKD
jgi:hypothetical protein